MTVINTHAQATATSSSSNTALPPNRGAVGDTSKSAAQKSNDNLQGNTVKISGHAMLLSRLFRTDNVNVDIPVVHTLTADNSGQLYAFLTKDDRKMLETAYEYASANGIDPRYVDDMAGDLAWYRQCPNDKGPLYDLGGHRLTFEFGTSDAKVVDRIQNSDAINNTAIDHGFIDYTFNTTVPVHAVSFEFLEKMISVCSTSAGKVPDVSGSDTTPSFTNFVPPKNDYITHVSAEAELPMPPEPDYISVNGVGHWRTPELAAAAAREASGHGRTEGGLTQYLTASNKKALTHALLSLLDRRTGETAARIKHIASVLDLPLTSQSGEKAAPDSSGNGALNVINNLTGFLDNNSSKDSFDADSLLKHIFSPKINTTA